MQVNLPLTQMTLEDKLKIMEDLWVDLTKDQNSYPSPDWHEDVLKLRATRVKEGKESYKDWESAKKELRDNL